MLVVAHSAHWLLEAGPLLVVPLAVLIAWLRNERSRRRAVTADDARAAAARHAAPSRPVVHDRAPHA